MATIELTSENINQTIQNNDMVLIDFWASWCGPCKTFRPVFEQAATKHPEMVFATVDTEKQQELAAAFGIRSIPTLAVLREQTVVFFQPGALPSTALEQLIAQVKALDMNDVRAKAKAEASAKDNSTQIHAHT